MKLYACTKNPGKLREFALVAARGSSEGIEIEPLPGLADIAAPDENGETFEQNASIKARYYSKFTQSIIFAEDSGLEVDALGGAPGANSARFAGPQATDAANNSLVLERLGESADRGARFVCVIAIAHSGTVLATFRGAVEGEILNAPRGQNGFGYDPLFFYPPLGRTFAELTPEEKLGVSHRGRATQVMTTWLLKHSTEFR
jgi:XTP/dITP diphosphohydrolase